MSEHEHGSMNIEVQEKAFAGFINASTWVAAGSIIVLIILALFRS